VSGEGVGVGGGVGVGVGVATGVGVGGSGISKLSTVFETPLLLFSPPPKNSWLVDEVAAR
jgi:hypothetical protein